jgi:hypothetical protein
VSQPRILPYWSQVSRFLLSSSTQRHPTTLAALENYVDPPEIATSKGTRVHVDVLQPDEGGQHENANN